LLTRAPSVGHRQTPSYGWIAIRCDGSESLKLLAQHTNEGEALAEKYIGDMNGHVKGRALKEKYKKK
jgi:hypothetical protein